MAFSRLEKAMALIIGLDIAAPGFSRAAAKSAVAALARVTPPLAAGVGTTAATFPVAPGAERGRLDRIRLEQAMADLTRVTLTKAKKRTKSKFNKMVSAGMKFVKGSTSYGKKGTINNAKKAFSAVTKAASAVTSGKKLPKSGIKRTLMSLMRRI